VARQVLLRAYALLILAIVLWTGYTAISYLARNVFASTRVPDRFLDPLARGMPSTKPSEPGATAIPLAEPDIRHYHRDPQKFAFIGSAGCTTSGCHTLLPHTKRKEVRAFANFHSTFLDCSSCHDASLQGPTAAVWLNNEKERPQDPPAMLRLATLLEAGRTQIEKNSSEISSRILALLRDSETNVLSYPVVRNLFTQLDTSDPGSPVWRQAMDELQAVLPNRVRGEYGARITPASVAQHWAERQSRLADLTRQFHSAPAGSAQRDALNKQIHEQVLAKPDACMACHRDQPSRFDFEALGYSPQRAAGLRDAAIARMIEQIRQGQPFYLPEILDRP
jgi:hypothetical protein